MNKFNDWLMDKLSNLLAMAWLFYLLNILAVIILVFQRPTDVLSWTLFIGTIYFQSVTLPVINNTAKRSGEQMMKLLQESHDAQMKELKVARTERLEIIEIHRLLIKKRVGGNANAAENI